MEEEKELYCQGTICRRQNRENQSAIPMLPFDHVRYEFLQMNKTARESNPSFDQRELFGTCPAQLLLQRRRCRNVIADNNRDDGFLTDGGCRRRHDANAIIIIIITRWDTICKDDGGGWWLFY